MQDNGGQVVTHRVITMLGRQEMDYLDKLGKDALFSTGHKLSYNDILRGLIDFAMEAGISGEKIDSAETFKDRLLRQLSRQEIKKGGN
ncbi:MAG: hypothetical protein PHC37_03335 [Candidatus Omnitrophica bacterium]|jgi:hypothetical protein|nr:hypothetical protein [Candidatus Omnitrophota bacterium]MDD5690715.1 hypothetical protein [Candidatus Omnitrophota bacterium]